MPYQFSASERRTRLTQARLMLIFTPQLLDNPLEKLYEVAEVVDIIQVRPKDLGSESQNPSSARDCLSWSNQVLQSIKALGDSRPLVLVNDRLDVARTLMHDGVDGVHLGQDDTPWQVARELLGPDLLVGLSTHDYNQVRNCANASVDYLGFGPVFPTATKELKGGNGSVSAWVAHQSSAQPLFPIGGITPENAWQLAPVRRAAVASSLLCADNPKQAAETILSALGARGTEKRQDR
ncbi:MAG: thiamine phosphate synthase [bacterium]|nr:thiamine phosphate synthase [bacterium]